VQNSHLPTTRGRPRKPPDYTTPLDREVTRTLAVKLGRAPTPGELAAALRLLKQRERPPAPPVNKSAKNRFMLEIRIARVLDLTLPAPVRRQALNSIKASDLV
jgi:hypothetical protein